MKNSQCGLIWMAWLLCMSTLSYAQSIEDLGQDYMKNGEFEKASVEYAKQVKQAEDRGGLTWVLATSYITSLQKAGKKEEVDKQLRRWLKSNNAVKLYALLLSGGAARSKGDTTLANKQFGQAFEQVKNDSQQLGRVGELYSELGETEWGIKAFVKEQELSNDRLAHGVELAQLYKLQGNTKKWIETLLPTAERPDKREQVQGIYQRILGTKDEEVLESVLYEQVQKQPESITVNDMLTWYYVQKQKFGRALVQEKALDKRMRLAGAKIIELANLAMINRDYKTAIDGFDYIIKSYPQGVYYPYARRMIINAREEQVKNGYPVDYGSLRKLIQEYNRVLADVGITSKTLEAMRSSANLYAYYLDERDSALAVLEKAILYGKNDQNFVDRCKLDKGDIHLLKNEPWESTLLYAQVAKSQKEELLGYEAKLKAAKLHYYKGDFELTKSLLDVLKMATTREIANDAEQLSMLILDNTGLDSTEIAMKDYAAIDLLLFQNKLDEAASQINQMLSKHKEHTLTDEILWLRAKIYSKQGKTEEALADLKLITDKYPLDILGDDALFERARITEEIKKDKQEALKLYQQFLTSYQGSLFSADVRKRLRLLRGDTVN